MVPALDEGMVSVDPCGEGYCGSRFGVWVSILSDGSLNRRCYR